ncbi:hypothetical protein Tco_0300972, partial [Tanacetum coccineum]
STLGVAIAHQEPLPTANQRYPWIRYQVEGYTEGIVHRFSSEVEDGVYCGRGAAGVHESCLEEIIWDPSTFGPRVHSEFGGVGRRMTRRQFILALGLHTEQKIAEAGYFLGPAPSYVLIRDPVRRLCHRMIAYSISGRGQAPEKVTGVDLFYLRSMDRGTTNVPHLLAQYLFRHAEGRKSRARLSGGHFIGRLAMHFGLAWVAQGLERHQVATAGAHEVDKAGLAADEGAQEIPAPAQAPPPPPPAPQPRTIGHPYQAFDSTLVGSSRMPYQRCVRPRTGDASTSAAPHADDQPDP